VVRYACHHSADHRVLSRVSSTAEVLCSTKAGSGAAGDGLVTTGGPPRSALTRSTATSSTSLPLHRGDWDYGDDRSAPLVCTHVPYAGGEARGAMLEARQRLLSLDELVPLPMPRVADHASQLGDSLRVKAR
jgi:hypothetical protein